MRKVVAAGSILVDKINEIGAYPKAGELTQIRARSRVPGGLVPNTGCDIHILDSGIPVSAFGAVGNDDDGRFAVAELKRRGLDTAGVVVKPTATSFTDVMSVPGGERTFFTYPGASADWGYDDFPFDLVQAGDLVLLGYFLLLAKIDAGDGLAIQGGTDLIDRINLRDAQRDAELAAMEEENARMRAEFASLSSGLNNMGSTIHSTLSGLAGDMQSVNAHYSNILTMFTNALSGNLQLRVMEDISDLDTDEDMNGKVLFCTNNGEINGDTDVGGIAGAMGVEAEFDLEGILSANITDSVQISTDSYFARCIVRKCLNNGLVSAKKDFDGGICGLAELGVISSSENYGDVKAGGNYCGGIVGQSKSIVTASYAMCLVDGSEYVGGIAGQGKRVAECSSIVDLDETIACSGAICGWADSEDEDLFIYHNTFVSDTLGGVDGISYDQAATPVSYGELCEMEGLPERFRSLKVCFRADGLVIRELSVPYGGAVDPTQIPAVPEIHGYSGFWPTTDLTRLTSSVTVDAVYLDRLTGLAADYVREGSVLPAVIIEGMFEPGSSVSVSDWSDGILPYEHYILCEALKVDVFSHVADLESYSIHYQMPQTSFLQGRPILCVKGENGLETREYTVDGSYMIFEATGSEIRFCVLTRSVDPGILAAGAALLALLLILLSAALLKRARRHRTAAAAEAADAGAAQRDEETDPLAAEEKETVGTVS